MSYPTTFPEVADVERARAAGLLKVQVAAQATIDHWLDAVGYYLDGPLGGQIPPHGMARVSLTEDRALPLLERYCAKGWYVAWTHTDLDLHGSHPQNRVYLWVSSKPLNRWTGGAYGRHEVHFLIPRGGQVLEGLGNLSPSGVPQREPEPAITSAYKAVTATQAGSAPSPDPSES